MKSRIILFAVTILMGSSLSNLSAQIEKEDISSMAKFQQVQISHDMNDLVTLEYVDAFAEGPWKMKVRVYTKSGKLLYTDISRKKGDTKVSYDISQFPAGDYTFELYKNRELVCSKAIVKQVSIANKESSIKSDISKYRQVEISYNKNDMVSLTYLDIFAEGRRKMEVRIYEESGELLYTKVLDKNGDVNMGFDISQFPDGNYVFELFQNQESVCSERIVKQKSMASANKKSDLMAQEDSTH